MEIEKAKTLQIGATVRCPADRGDHAYAGRVVHISATVSKNWSDVDYIWITVEDAHGRKAVWPANRIG